MRRIPNYPHNGFRNIVDSYYEEILRRNPLVATWLGEHQYDGLLPEVGMEAVEKDIAFMRITQDRFTSFPERDLTTDEKLDRRIVLHNIELGLFFYDELKRWRLGIDLASNIGDGIFMLYAREFSPLHERVESMISRLRAAPMYLQSGKSLFQAVPKLWGEIFLESARQVPTLLDTIEKSISGRIPEFLWKEYNKAASETKKSLAHFSHWFENAIQPKTSGDWALGPGPFQANLMIRRLGLSSPEILELGELFLKKANEKVECCAKNLSPSGNRQEVHYLIKCKAPKTFDQVLDAYRDSVTRSRSFIERAGFATLPQDEFLEVMETPSYMAHLIPFAAYMSPERRARPQKGIYLVTRDPNSEDMSRHNYADISNTSVHEGYPGHHLQLASQNVHPSKVRVLSDSIELIEGWAHYCEEEMKNLGFEASEENYFVQGIDEAWRAARVLIDVNIHQKTWSFEQGHEFLMKTTGMSNDEALSEMKRYTQTPGYPLSYMIGKHLLYQLKDDLKKRFSSSFSERSFHDLILSEGSIPNFMGREFYSTLLSENLRKEQNQEK